MKTLDQKEIKEIHGGLADLILPIILSKLISNWSSHNMLMA